MSLPLYPSSGRPEEVQLEEYHSLLFNKGRWFQFPKALLKLQVPPRKLSEKQQARHKGKKSRTRKKALKQLEYAPAVLLAFLINYYYMLQDALEDKLDDADYGELLDKQFYCKSRTITRHIGMSEDAQTGHLARLEECEFIRTSIQRSKGHHRRYIEINFYKIVDAIQAGM